MAETGTWAGTEGAVSPATAGRPVALAGFDAPGGPAGLPDAPNPSAGSVPKAGDTSEGIEPGPTRVSGIRAAGGGIALGGNPAGVSIVVTGGIGCAVRIAAAADAAVDAAGDAVGGRAGGIAEVCVGIIGG